MLYAFPADFYEHEITLLPGYSPSGPSGGLNRSYGEGVTIPANVAGPSVGSTETAGRDSADLRHTFTCATNPDLTDPRTGLARKLRIGDGVLFMGVVYAAAGPMVVEGSLPGDVVTSWKGEFGGVAA